MQRARLLRPILILSALLAAGPWLWPAAPALAQAAAPASEVRIYDVDFSDQVKYPNVCAQVAPLDSALAATFIQKAQEVIDVLSGGLTNPGGRPHGRFTSVTRRANGQVQMDLSAEPGRIHILETSSNLVDWEMIGVAAKEADGSFAVEDPNAARFPNRFYRLVSP